MDWLLPLRDGDENPEARYAIRSWVQNARLVEGLDRLITVGYCPDWLSPDLHIPGNTHRSGPLNVYCNIRDASAGGLLGETVLALNDDIFALEPLDPSVIYYRATLAEHIRALPKQATWWASSLRLTHAYLRAHGVTDALSYELHRPLLIDTAAMARALTDAWTGHGYPVQWRTVYGNLEHIGGERSRDHKVIGRRGELAGPWLSTTDGAWRSGWDQQIMPLFPTPTIWEIS